MSNPTQFVRKLQWAILGTALAAAAGACIPGAGQVDYEDVVALSLMGSGGAGSVTAFKSTLYPVVRAQCASCHGRSQTPLFATTNLAASHGVSLTKVNFSDPSLSRIARKSMDSHCGGACAGNGTAFVNAIAAWGTLREKLGANPLPDAGIGNIFTHEIPVPAIRPACNLPGDLALPRVPGDPNNCWDKLRFPVSKMTTLPGFALSPLLARAWFEVDFSYEVYPDINNNFKASYVMKNARFVNPDGASYVFDIKFFMNGKYQPELGIIYSSVDKVVDQAVFDPVDCTVPASPASFDPNTIGANCRPSTPVFPMMTANIRNVIQQKMAPEVDTISFSFTYLRPVNATSCKNIQMWENLVFAPIERGAVACLTCHRNGGLVPEPARRFNMDPTDPANGATRQQALATICQRFLQRSNLASPDDSPIITQPTKGMNGMPPQNNFGVFAPDWRTWILEEDRLK